MKTSSFEIRGTTLSRSNTSVFTRVLIKCVHISFLLWGFVLGNRLFKLPLVPNTASILLVLVTGIALWALSIWLLKATPGEILLGSRKLREDGLPVGFKRFSGRAYTIEKNKGARRVLSKVAAFIWIGSSLYALSAQLANYPLFATISTKNYQAFVPPEDYFKNKMWTHLPFYYTIGAWPTQYNGSPILYTLPYQPTPLGSFKPKIIARWSMPEVEVVIEGPKTPTRENETPELVRKCFTQLWSSWQEGIYHCVQIRDQSLTRHLKEFQEKNLTVNTIEWFQVDNPHLPEEEQAKGLHLVASNSQVLQERYIFITAKGSHQMILLNTPTTDQGKFARMLLEQTIRSFRLAYDLSIGKALIQQRLAETTLDHLQEMDDTMSFVNRIAEVQAMLVAKISVDPKDPIVYHHLGATAYYLAKHAYEIRLRKTQVISGQLLLLLDEWAAAAKPILESAAKYSKDIDPESKSTQRLQFLWAEIQKF
jgi:hypothetical protein